MGRRSFDSHFVDYRSRRARHQWKAHLQAGSPVVLENANYLALTNLSWAGMCVEKPPLTALPSNASKRTATRWNHCRFVKHSQGLCKHVKEVENTFLFVKGKWAWIERLQVYQDVLSQQGSTSCSLRASIFITAPWCPTLTTVCSPSSPLRWTHLGGGHHTSMLRPPPLHTHTHTAHALALSRRHWLWNSRRQQGQQMTSKRNTHKLGVVSAFQVLIWKLVLAVLSCFL